MDLLDGVVRTREGCRLDTIARNRYAAAVEARNTLHLKSATSHHVMFDQIQTYDDRANSNDEHIDREQRELLPIGKELRLPIIGFGTLHTKPEHTVGTQTEPGRKSRTDDAQHLAKHWDGRSQHERHSPDRTDDREPRSSTPDRILSHDLRLVSPEDLIAALGADVGRDDASDDDGR